MNPGPDPREAEHRRELERLLAFLAREGVLNRSGGGPTRHLQTHISHVFLAGQEAYKLKKPVEMGFLDFGDRAKRRHYTFRELELNQRLAPQVYRRVVAAIPRGDGFVLEPTAPGRDLDAEHILCMARMDQERMLDRLLVLDQVPEAAIAEIAEIMARFYAAGRRSPQVDHLAGPQTVAFNVRENFHQTEPFLNRLVDPARWSLIRDWSLGFLARGRRLLAGRVEAGRARDGHGDLHAGNINLAPEGPVIFDCIEFNDRFRYQDWACDLAFLAMDLDFHGRSDLAELLRRGFATAAADPDLGEVWDFFKSYRAMVRAKVLGFAWEQAAPDDPARQGLARRSAAYYGLAAQYAGARPRRYLVGFMGLMASGKSRRARDLCQRLDLPLLASDPLRKEIFGLESTDRAYDGWNQGLYTPQAHQETYRQLFHRAGWELAARGVAVVDASFREDAWRRVFMQTAARWNAQPLLVWVRASRPVMLERLTKREREGRAVSDGRVDLLEQQMSAWEPLAEDLGPTTLEIDGDHDPAAGVDLVLARLSRMGLAHGE